MILLRILSKPTAIRKGSHIPFVFSLIFPIFNKQLANTAGVVVDGSTYTTSTSSFPFPGLLSTAGSTGGPKACLNWIIFGKNYNYLTGGFMRMSTAAREYGQDVAHERLFGSVTISEPGYVYIYLSNEETTPVEVYFDDFKVDQIRSPVIQGDDYYPFGLTFNSYRRESSGPNKRLYNDGSEIQDALSLNVFQTQFRILDQSLGRWWQIDPKADSLQNFTPYNYSFNNPVRYNDPKGDCPWCWGAVVGFAVEYTSQVVGNIIQDNGQISIKAFTNVDATDLLVATGVGASTGGLSALTATYTKAAITGGIVAVNALGESVKATTDVNVNLSTGDTSVSTIIDSKSAAKVGVEFATGMLPTPDVSGKTVSNAVNAVSSTVIGAVKSTLDEGINAQVKQDSK